jgi:hypothetical protein
MASIVVKSQTFSFIPEDLKSLGIGALIAAGGALLTYLAENLGNVNFGEYTPVAVAVLGILINVVRKFILTSKYAK